MAETFLYSIAGRILGELSSPALRRIGLLWGFKTDLRKLEDSISTIKAVLLDAEEKKTTNHEVRDWLKKLKAAIDDADDVIDDLSTQVLRDRVVTRDKRAKKVRDFLSRSNLITFRYKMGRKVTAIRERLDDIAADRIKFHFRERLDDDDQLIENKRREETHSFVRAEEIIGRESDKNAIVELLLNSDFQEDVVVVPIVGIGGLGKTALAQLAYNDEEVKKHFQLRMWVCVSDVFDVKLITQNSIESATGNKCNRIQMDGVKDELGKQIDGKKYLLVLDDVWNEDPIKWQKLKELLMGGARGSKILLTTRTELVAKITSTVLPYLLKGLSEIESWSLFRQVAFKHGVEPERPTMVAIGKGIVKKCVGVPLAIRTVGGLLYIKDTEEEWLYFKDDELSKIAQTESGIFPILKLSYDYLPSYVKRCFAYCSIFPKDHFIHKNTLIRLWIAQGFIQLSDERQRLEDVGDQYFMDLLRRSFFQDAVKDERGNVLGCKMHDLIHDLAQLIAGSKNCTIGGGAKYFDRETRHVFVNTDIKDLANNLERFSEANKLRTLLLATHEWNQQFVEECINWVNETISSFKRVRALDLNGFRIKEVPSSISELGQLRYLDLSGSRFELLPECICRLHNLQTLILNGCLYLNELPKETKNLVSLRHLEIDCCSSLSYMPRGLGELTSLQTLTQFVVDPQDTFTAGFSGGLSELEGLVNLRGNLWIGELKGSTAESKKTCPNHSYLVRMEFLEELCLVWYYDDDNSRENYEPDIVSAEEQLFESLQPHPNLKKLEMKYYRGVSFPSWMTVDIGLSLPNLVEISLVFCHGWKHLTPLGHLPSLQVLVLVNMDNLRFLYEEEDCDGSGQYGSSSYSSSSKAHELFPSLKWLRLSNLEHMKGLGRREKKRDVIFTAAKELLLTSSFGATRHLSALHHLDIRYCPRLFSGDDENDMQSQSRLELSTAEMPDLELPIPVGREYLTTLQSLSISSWHDLMNLPEWIGKLRSLQKLEIRSCESLMSLPKWMCSLTTLHELIITDCSFELYVRCLMETGEDWPKIAHIPHITIIKVTPR